MSLFQGVILGLVQGIAEFLPISSSAHLILIPWILAWDDGGLTFDIALHAGTLIALLIYFRNEWLGLAKGLMAYSKDKTNRDGQMAIYIILATIPGAIMGLLLEKKAEHAFRDPRIVATNLAFMGFVLWIMDRKGKKTKKIEEISLKESLLIGVAQGFAVIPGFSRAGVTISTALIQGFDRESSARFSFFLSMPIIAGACLLKLRHLTMGDLTLPFLAGIFAAAVSGYLAIGGLIRFLQQRSYGVFAIYRVAAGLVVWILYSVRAP